MGLYKIEKLHNKAARTKMDKLNAANIFEFVPRDTICRRLAAIAAIAAIADITYSIDEIPESLITIANYATDADFDLVVKNLTDALEDEKNINEIYSYIFKNSSEFKELELQLGPCIDSDHEDAYIEWKM